MPSVRPSVIVEAPSPAKVSQLSPTSKAKYATTKRTALIIAPMNIAAICRSARFSALGSTSVGRWSRVGGDG